MLQLCIDQAGSREVCALKMREPKVGSAQLSTSEICSLDICKLKVCLPQVDPSKVCPLEVCPPQVSPVETLTRQIHLAEGIPIQLSEWTNVK